MDGRVQYSSAKTISPFHQKEPTALFILMIQMYSHQMIIIHFFSLPRTTFIRCENKKRFRNVGEKSFDCNFLPSISGDENKEEKVLKESSHVIHLTTFHPLPLNGFHCSKKSSDVHPIHSYIVTGNKSLL